MGAIKRISRSLSATLQGIMLFKLLNSKKKRILAAALHFGDKTDEHHIFLLSGGIAFNILLCIIPLFLVAVFIVGLFLDYRTISVQLVSSLEPLLPPSKQSASFLSAIVGELKKISDLSATAGWIGLGVLLWTASALLSSVRSSLNLVFEISTPKIFLFYRMKDIILIAFMAFLILIFALVMPVFGFASALVARIFPHSVRWLVSGVSAFAITVFTNYFLMYFIYRFAPNAIVPRFAVKASSLCAVVALTLSKYIFGWYINSIGNYGKFYGAYAALAAIAVWIYYSSLIILISAELGFLLYKLKNKKIDLDAVIAKKFGA